MQDETPPAIDPENPSSEKLRAYGELMFLVLRSRFHRETPVRNIRLSFQPAIDLGFYKIFRADGVPRAAVTWAFLSPEVERRYMQGYFMQPQEWVSGKQMWVVEIVAPYGQGTAVSVVNWLRRKVAEPIDTVRYVRGNADGSVRRVVEIRRGEGAIRGARRLRPGEI